MEKAEAQRAVDRALNFLESRDSVTIVPEPGVTGHIAQSCGGDIRKALNAVEFLYTATRPVNGVVTLTMQDAKQVSQRSAMRYDKAGDDHYDDLSALMKSIRGSDPDAAVHYLARFLEAGDLPSACRRILCSVAEDIGLAYPQAIPIVKACVDSALQLGLPADGTGFERDQGYLYPHNFPNHWVRQQYLPDVIKDRTYYTYGDNKTEQAAKRYWEEIKK